jgi:hypothetical protein
MGEMCVTICPVLVSGVFWWIVTLVLIWGGVLENTSLLPGRWSALPVFAVPFLGGTPPDEHVIGTSCPSWISRSLQEKMAQRKGHRYQMEAGWQFSCF